MNLKKIHLILFLKPYYNWTAFNTLILIGIVPWLVCTSFKPYYKWNAFNTKMERKAIAKLYWVLNLVISGTFNTRNLE